MNKLVKFSLAAVAIAVLAACSSGGGKGADNNSSAAQSKPADPATKPTDKPATSTANTSEKAFGGVYSDGKGNAGWQGAFGAKKQ